MLKQRIITAVILAVSFITLLLLLPAWAVMLLLAAVVTLAAWEWSLLAGLQGALPRSLFAFSVVLLMLVACWFGGIFDWRLNVVTVRDVLAVACLWWVIALLWIKSYPGSAVIWRSTAARVVMGWLTLLPAWLALAYLLMQDFGAGLLLALISLVAAADIGAYFSGRAYGKAKLAPHVSPGKSWAGFWGGMAATTGLAVVLWLLFDIEVGLFTVIAVAVLTALASVLGDLLESMVKRQQGVKDSGRILPGHGGVMDRIDGITAAAPVFALSLILVS